MKKASVMLSSLLLLNAVTSFAQVRPSLRSQNANAATDKVSAPHTEAMAPAPVQAIAGVPKVQVGTIETSTTIREKVLRYPRLIPMELGYEVKGFTFTFVAGDKTLGPVVAKGAVFTEEMKDIIKETDGGKVKITIDNIRLDAGGKEIIANPIVLEYDH